MKFINKVGIFLQDVAAGLHFVKEYQPKAVLLMDASPLQIQYVRDNSPQTKIIWWKHEGDQHWSTTDPEYWANTIWSQIAGCPPDYVYYWNEPLGHDAVGQFADFDSRQARFIRRMRQLSGGQVKVGAFCFAEGNFTKDGPDLPVNFPQSVDEADMVFIHEYWKPRLNSQGMRDYHCLRWPYWLGQFERVGRSDLEIGVTECGVTMAVGGGPDVGYLSEEAMSTGLTWQQYQDDLDEYHTRCCQEPRIRFIIPFLVSPWPGQWQSFRLDIHTELLNHIMTMKVPGEETPGNGGNNMQVYDINGTLLSESAANGLLSKYGVRVSVPTGLTDGQYYWAISKIWEKTGVAAFVAFAKDRNGTPVNNPDSSLDLTKLHRAFWWRNMGDANDIESPYSTDREAEADLGGLESGAGGSGMGTGAYTGEYGNPDEGPHRAWVRHPSSPSDELIGIRMIAGTNHNHLDAEWQETTYQGNGEEPTPPPEGIPPMEGSLLDRVLELESQVRSLGTLDITEMLNTISQIKSLLAG